VRRSEQTIRAAAEVPIASSSAGFMPQLGELSLEGEYGVSHYSDAGTLNNYAVALTWEPVSFLRLHGALEQTELPALIELLGNPVLITPDVRVFDPLTGNTVDVVQITGGNPSIRPERDRIRRLSALFRLVPRLNLQLSTEYTDTDRRNFLSFLPDESAAIMLAFPDRFVRDSNGVLTTIDLRPVNFDSEREKRLRWGLSMNTRLDGTPAAPTHGGAHTPPTNLQLTVNHTVVFSDTITIRPGLDTVDVLGGGAIGVGGGRLRHQVDGTAAVTSGGLGARIGVTWRGASKLETRIGATTDTLRFSPALAFNLRAFAEVKRILPHSKWARGLRLSLDVLNVTNDRQNVRDSLGNTPLQYQPGYRDPVGRTIELEIRKVF
jgi:outer membrane receptor protein involved in Fe transport